MKTKNKVLMVALMLVASIFCSSCIIIGDWYDDEYAVYYYSDADSKWDLTVRNAVPSTGNTLCQSSSNYEFSKNIEGKSPSYWTRQKIENFLVDCNVSSYEARQITNQFLSYNHGVIFVRNTSATITAIVK